ncbi:MAG: hypothetical protein EOP24_39640 [Hyphomicrobiales bacterium]|nr:MAG: hypothetical protein EOP24_39640 [Hyphomicrobiales bacterium]
MPTEGTPEPDRASLSPGVVRTGLAGVMYLLNLTDRLGLPDHADPRWRLPELSGWAQLEVLARGLLDQDYVPGEEHDPLWRLLAELDGRPPQCAVGFEVAELGMGNPPPDEPIPTALMRSVATGTRRWMRTASPSAGRRLAAELGMKTAADAAAALRVPGLIHHSRTHVDVVMDLDSISVPVRLAGLDQDPGWVPRLGRVVAFIFTSDGPA